MNRSTIFLVLLLIYGCKSYEKLTVNNKLNEIKGVWYQTNTALFNEVLHMMGPNRWNFGIDKCQILINSTRKYEYSFKYTNRYLELSPIKAKEYEEWENVLFFDKRITVDLNDSIMVWSIPDTLQIKFKRTQ